jgi:hypothetical protein
VLQVCKPSAWPNPRRTSRFAACGVVRIGRPVHHTAEVEMLWPPTQTKLGDRPNGTDVLVEMADEHSRLDPVLREIHDNLAQGSGAVGAFRSGRDRLATVRPCA